MKTVKTSTSLLACLLAGSAMADTTLIYNDQSGTETSRMMLTDGWVKMQSREDDNTSIIFDASSTSFVIVNHAERTFLRFGEKEIAALSDVSAMVDKMLEEQLAQMPAAQREQMRGMMKSMVEAQMPKQKPFPEYSKTSKTAEYNGYACQVVMKKASGQKDESFCVTDHDKLGISDAEYQAVEDFMGVAEKMASQFGQDQSMNFSAIGDVVPVYYEMNSIKGYLTEVNHDALPAGTFKVPSGYREETLPNVFGG